MEKKIRKVSFSLTETDWEEANEYAKYINMPLGGLARFAMFQYVRRYKKNVHKLLGRRKTSYPA